MARGWHYTKLSLSSTLLLSFYGMCFMLLSIFFVVFVLFLFSCFRVELCRCSYDIFLSNKPRTGMVTTYITGYG